MIQWRLSNTSVHWNQLHFLLPLTIFVWFGSVRILLLLIKTFFTSNIMRFSYRISKYFIIQIFLPFYSWQQNKKRILILKQCTCPISTGNDISTHNAIRKKNIPFHNRRMHTKILKWAFKSSIQNVICASKAFI